jgi:hypothetical protein
MRLDPLAYGTSWVTPDFVARTAAAVCEPGQLSSFAFGLDGRQDLYVVARPPDVPADALSIAPVPRGDLDRLDFSWGGTLVCEGHLDSPGEAEVVFLVRDEERGRMSIGEGEQPRTWTFEVPIPDVSPDDVLRIEARTPAGRERILAMGTLMPFL